MSRAARCRRSVAAHTWRRGPQAALPLSGLSLLLAIANPAVPVLAGSPPAGSPISANNHGHDPSHGASSTPSLGEAMGPSSPEQLALAEHLRRSGVVFYGAWWCPACFKQKDLFGQQAGNRLPYVECDKDQPGRDRCQAADVKAYPTWVWRGERRVGVQSLEELKRWSGFSGGSGSAAQR